MRGKKVASGYLYLALYLLNSQPRAAFQRELCLRKGINQPDNRKSVCAKSRTRNAQPICSISHRPWCRCESWRAKGRRAAVCRDRSRVDEPFEALRESRSADKRRSRSPRCASANPRCHNNTLDLLLSICNTVTDDSKSTSLVKISFQLLGNISPVDWGS